MDDASYRWLESEDPLNAAPELDMSLGASLGGGEREAAELLRALAHEARVGILCCLAKGEKSVGEIGERFQLPQSFVSQQLKRLRIEGLVATRRAGKKIYYRIADAKILPILGALNEVFCRPRERAAETGAARSPSNPASL